MPRGRRATPNALTHSLRLVSASRLAYLCRSRPRGSIREQAAAQNKVWRDAAVIASQAQKVITPCYEASVAFLSGGTDFGAGGGLPWQSACVWPPSRISA